jgi:hypothetical protein
MQKRPVEITVSAPTVNNFCDKLIIEAVMPDGQKGEVVLEVQNGHLRVLCYVSDGAGGLEDEVTFRTVPEFDENAAILGVFK